MWLCRRQRRAGSILRRCSTSARGGGPSGGPRRPWSARRTGRGRSRRARRERRKRRERRTTTALRPSVGVRYGSGRARRVAGRYRSMLSPGFGFRFTSGEVQRGAAEIPQIPATWDLKRRTGMPGAPSAPAPMSCARGRWLHPRDARARAPGTEPLHSQVAFDLHFPWTSLGGASRY
jgi:hypothetical protein